MSIAYRRRWLRRLNATQNEGQFYQAFRVGFQFRFFLRTAHAYTVHYFKC